MSEPGQESERGRTALGADLIIPVLGCALAAYYFVSTGELVWEAKATGIVIGAILFALSAVQFGRIAVEIANGRGDLGVGELGRNDLFNRQRAALFLLTLLFVLGLPILGTTLGLFLVLIASMWVLGVRRWRTLLAVAFATAATVHILLIVLLGSRLPQGLIGRLFGAGGS